MLNKILFLILCGAIIIYLMNKETLTTENFRDNPHEAPPYIPPKAMPSIQVVMPQKDLPKTKLLQNTLKDKVSENRIQDYNQILLEDTADLTYYENNVINQSNINENAYDIVNQIDLVDYGKVTTGMDKCNLNCDGVCLELGYTGSATCFPKTTPFDYGTLYKNPTFTYGLDQKRFVKI
jgi:hypothetical protein